MSTTDGASSTTSLTSCALTYPRLRSRDPAVGKTATALQRAATVYRLDDEAERSIAQADPSRLLTGERPVLIDEWQRLPESFDRVRRAVDDGAGPGSFLLTGSASPTNPPTHSGAGRIVRVRLRPMTLAERDVASPL
jgi:predicted AAA+ superfamily ATPase